MTPTEFSFVSSTETTNHETIDDVSPTVLAKSSAEMEIDTTTKEDNNVDVVSEEAKEIKKEMRTEKKHWLEIHDIDTFDNIKASKKDTLSTTDDDSLRTESITWGNATAQSIALEPLNESIGSTSTSNTNETLEVTTPKNENPTIIISTPIELTENEEKSPPLQSHANDEIPSFTKDNIVEKDNFEKEQQENNENNEGKKVRYYANEINPDLKQEKKIENNATEDVKNDTTNKSNHKKEERRYNQDRSQEYTKRYKRKKNEGSS